MLNTHIINTKVYKFLGSEGHTYRYVFLWYLIGVVLLCFLVFFFVHILSSPIHIRGSYVEEYVPLELTVHYDVKFFYDHHMDYRKLLDAYLPYKTPYDLHSVKFRENFRTCGPVDGYIYCINADFFSPLESNYYSATVLQIKNIMSILKCPVYIESHSVYGTLYDFLFCEVPLEVGLALVTMYIGRLNMHPSFSTLKLPLYGDSVLSQSIFDFLTLYHILVLLLLTFIVILALMYMEVIPFMLGLHTTLLILLFCVGVITFIVEHNNLSLLNDYNVHTYHLCLYDCKHLSLPDYRVNKFYGIKHIFDNMDNLHCLRYPIYGHYYVVNPSDMGVPHLHEHFIKCVPLGHIKGLVTFEGFPLYVKDGRLYIQIPTGVMLEIQETLSNLKNIGIQGVAPDTSSRFQRIVLFFKKLGSWY